MIAENEVDGSCRELGGLQSDLFDKLDFRPQKKKIALFMAFINLCQQQDVCKPL